MSFQITTAFVKQYTANVQLLSQQKGSKLRGCVREEPVTGETAFFDQIGATEMQDVNDRHGNSPQVSTPHSRRRVTPSDKDWGDFVDKLDKVKMLNDPTNVYARNAAFAAGRAIDKTIIAAAFDPAYTGKEGSVPVTFPTSQVVAVASAGLTLAKLIAAREMLLDADVDEDEPFYIACTPKQISNLLITTEATSIDYNTIKALVKGDINTFMGFEFKRISSKYILTDGDEYRRVPAWAKNGICLGTGQEPVGRISERSDKRYSTYVYYCQSMGATRMEEEKVVEIKCLEA